MRRHATVNKTKSFTLQPSDFWTGTSFLLHLFFLSPSLPKTKSSCNFNPFESISVCHSISGVLYSCRIHRLMTSGQMMCDPPTAPFPDASSSFCVVHYGYHSRGTSMIESLYLTLGFLNLSEFSISRCGHFSPPFFPYLSVFPSHVRVTHDKLGYSKEGKMGK